MTEPVAYHGGDGTAVSPTLGTYLPPLKRIAGQVTGITTMIEEERSPIEIVQQIMAARSALSRVAQDMLSQEAVRCANEQCFDDLRSVMKELLK